MDQLILLKRLEHWYSPGRMDSLPSARPLILLKAGCRKTGWVSSDAGFALDPRGSVLAMYQGKSFQFTGYYTIQPFTHENKLFGRLNEGSCGCKLLTSGWSVRLRGKRLFLFTGNFEPLIALFMAVWTNWLILCLPLQVTLKYKHSITEHNLINSLNKTRLYSWPLLDSQERKQQAGLDWRGFLSWHHLSIWPMF